MNDFLDYLENDRNEIDRLLDKIDAMENGLPEGDWDEMDPPYHILVDEE